MPASAKADMRTRERHLMHESLDRIERGAKTTTWDKAIIDRTSHLKNWVEVFKSLG